MSDESQLQVGPTDGRSSLTLSKTRSNLIARGRKDAAIFARPSPLAPIEPLSETRRRAEEGNRVSQWKLGRAHSSGEGVPQDYAEALKWYRKAADAGYKLAVEMIGYCYLYGEGVPQDHAEAAKWLRRSTPSQCGIAELTLGKFYFYGDGVQQDYAEAVKWLLGALSGELYEESNDETGYLLARVYALEALPQWRWHDEGEDVWLRYTEEVKWHRECADEGNVFSQFCVGLVYTYGRGLTQDDGEAAKWFRKAADAGDVWAQFHLAVAYDKGRGVPQDYVQAHLWFNLAASRTTGQAQKYASDERDSIARKMTSQQIAEAQRLASEWKPT
jgi:TPR repeat protein